MKKIYLLFSILILFKLSLEAQTLPTIGNISKSQINISSNSNMLIVDGVTDGDVINQPLTVLVTSSDPLLLTIDSTGYTAGNSYIILKATEKIKVGTVTITVKVTDADGTKTKDFIINIGQFLKHGVTWSIYDIVFWQRVNTYAAKEKSLYDTLLTDLIYPQFGDSYYEQFPLTVGPSAGFGKSSFFTSMFKGYIAPVKSGQYNFSLNSQDYSVLYLSPDDKFENAVEILNSTQYISVLKTLRNDRKYAFYAINYRVFSPSMNVEWESTALGIPKSSILSPDLFPSIDLVTPTQSKSQLLIKGIDMAQIKWTKSTDLESLKGYNIYVNGIKTVSTRDTSYFIKGLTANTPYSVFVTSYDANGNESFPTNTLSFTTYPADNTKPSPPTVVQASKISDMSATITWSGATDGQTEVYAYNLYLDNVLYNTSGPIIGTDMIVKVLAPLSSHSVTIEAIDVGQNVSVKSATFNFKTTKFDPLSSAPGIKKARLNIGTQGIARNEGFAINANFVNESYYTGAERTDINEFKPSAERWGTLINAYQFKDYSGSGKVATYARFLKKCNDQGIPATIVTGVANGSDWMTDKNTFLHFIEYLNGPANSTYGAIRAAEGISQPLFANSKGVLIEFGNEVWGAAAHQAEIGADYAVYAKWCREMVNLMKTSPYFDNSKVTFAYSGRNPSPADSYGLNSTVVAGDTGEVDVLAVSGYLGGNLTYDANVPSGKTESEYYVSGLQYMAKNVLGFQSTLKSQFASIGRYLPGYFYESNMTTSAYNGRLGQAIIMTDYLMSMTKYGGIYPNLFHLTSGEWRITEPTSNKKFPLFYTGKFVNHFTKGNMLKSDVQTLDKIPGTSSEAVGTHVFSQKGKYSILLLSRDFENDCQLQLDLPNGIPFGSTARRYLVTGVDFNTKAAIIDSSTVTLSDSMLVVVPKHSMVIYTFGGPDLGQKDLPAGYTRFLKLAKLTILPDSGTFLNGYKKTLTFGVKLEPVNALFKEVKWSVTNSAGIPVTTTLLSTGKYSITGAGTCAGNGKLMLKVMDPSDTTIFDQTEIVIGYQCPNAVNSALENSISLFPNPVKNIFSIESSEGKITEVRVTNLLGDQLQNIKAAENNISVDLSNSPIGVYIIEIETEAGIIRKKVLKQ